MLRAEESSEKEPSRKITVLKTFFIQLFQPLLHGEDSQGPLFTEPVFIYWVDAFKKRLNVLFCFKRPFHTISNTSSFSPKTNMSPKNEKTSTLNFASLRCFEH